MYMSLPNKPNIYEEVVTNSKFRPPTTYQLQLPRITFHPKKQASGTHLVMESIIDMPNFIMSTYVTRK
jgi:hypothetical protein